MQRGTQKSFHEILEEHLGEEPEVSEKSETTANHSSIEYTMFNSWQTLQNFALKNIKTHFANTTYRVHIVDQESKRAEALQLKYQSLHAKIDNIEVQQAFKFFFDRGVVGFLDLSINSLKKDFRILAKKLHPDLSSKSTSASEKAEEFHILKKSYDVLSDYLRSQKHAA